MCITDPSSKNKVYIVAKKFFILSASLRWWWCANTKGLSEKVLVLVSRNETEGNKISISSRKLKSVCDETQNLNGTESETFFQSHFFSIPNLILFSIPIFFRYRIRYFFWYQNFSKPIPILFPIPNFFETDTDTFIDTKIFRNRYRKTWKGFETESETF